MKLREEQNAPARLLEMRRRDGGRVPPRPHPWRRRRLGLGGGRAGEELLDRPQAEGPHPAPRLHLALPPLRLPRKLRSLVLAPPSLASPRAPPPPAATSKATPPRLSPAQSCTPPRRP